MPGAAGSGGKRPGAGRKKGSKTTVTTANEKFAIAALKSGVTPLEYMLSVMRQPVPKKADRQARALIDAQRFEAAKAAAPYLHPRLSAIEMDDKNKPGDLDKSDPNYKQQLKARIRVQSVKLGLSRVDSENVVPIKKRA